MKIAASRCDTPQICCAKSECCRVAHVTGTADVSGPWTSHVGCAIVTELESSTATQDPLWCRQLQIATAELPVPDSSRRVLQLKPLWQSRASLEAASQHCTVRAAVGWSTYLGLACVGTWRHNWMRVICLLRAPAEESAEFECRLKVRWSKLDVSDSSM